MADIKEDVGAHHHHHQQQRTWLGGIEALNSESQRREEGGEAQNSRPKRVASLDIFRGLTVAVS